MSHKLLKSFLQSISFILLKREREEKPFLFFCGLEYRFVTRQQEMEENLPPGFRFHPTDEELITHYLCRKVSNIEFTGKAVVDVDLNKCEPWDLPGNYIYNIYFDHFYKLNMFLVYCSPLFSQINFC